MEINKVKSPYISAEAANLIFEGACVGFSGAIAGLATGIFFANQEVNKCQLNGPNGCMDTAPLAFILYPIFGLILGSITAIGLDALRHSRNSKNQLTNENPNIIKA